MTTLLGRWSDRVGKHLSLGPLGYRLFPLALLVEGGRAIEVFQASNRATLPEQLFRAQFSRQFVEQYFQRTVETDNVVDDVILGTKIDGQSHLSGIIGITLVPDSKEIRFDLVFRGVCRSRTEGVNTVVVLQNTAETQFEARKQFVWNSQGLASSPTIAVAKTRSTTNRIETGLPGVIGDVARQIAQARVAEVRPQADAIAAQHAAARIERALDARVDESVAWMRLISRYLPAAGQIQRMTRIKLSCTREAVEIVILRRDLENIAALSNTPPLPGDCDLSIQIHRGTLLAMAHDPLALLMGAAVAHQVFATEEEPAVETPAGVALDSPALAWRFTRSPDGEWLVVRHVRQAQRPQTLSTVMPAAPTVR
ncbi:MAG TPA: hypothetical protein VHY91_19915 [Pirellulales bacterium]|nr:hypothetical protein [Pirellulales bacterium]